MPGEKGPNVSPKPPQEKNYEIVATQEGAVAVPKGKAEEFLSLPKEEREKWLKNNPVEKK